MFTHVPVPILSLRFSGLSHFCYEAIFWRKKNQNEWMLETNANIHYVDGNRPVHRNTHGEIPDFR
jgi:hypothetical protein